MKKLVMAAVIGCLVTTSCTQVASWFSAPEDSTKGEAMDSPSYAAFARDESITEANAYSDLFLDSASIENYIQKEKLEDSAARALRGFYRVRNYQYAWFTSGGMTEQAKGLWNVYTEDSSHAGKALKQQMDTLLQNDSLRVIKGDSSFVRTELALTRELVHYAQGQPNGVITSANFYYLVPAKKQDPLLLADSVLHKQSDSALYTGNKAYHSLKQQLAVYYKAAKDSNWQVLPAGVQNLKKGASSPAVTALKKHLRLTGDYTASDTTHVFTDSLEMAIKEVQQRNGLAPTGMVNDSLVAVLNISPEQRVEQLLVNMNRVLWMQPPGDSNRIVVNIPSLALTVFEDSGRVFQMPVIVGRKGTSTLLFSGAINQIVFHPEWRIPQSIVERDILPKMKADPHYLKKNNMEIVSQKDSIPVIRQLAGKDNAMGKVKFLFPNSYDIYLHDTPEKTLFAQQNRALSNGCIRVADAEKLAQYLLRDQKEWTPDKIRAAMNGDKTQTVNVKNPEPVYLTYYTAWVDENGRLNFRNDIYGHDQETAERMFTKTG